MIIIVVTNKIFNESDIFMENIMSKYDTNIMDLFLMFSIIMIWFHVVKTR